MGSEPAIEPMILSVGTPPTPPRWATELFPDRTPLAHGTASFRARVSHRALDLDVVGRTGLALIGARLENAVELGPGDLRAAVCESYGHIRRALAASPAANPVRVWNFVPRILEPMGGGLNRYEVFNAGRYDSFCEWFGEPDRFAIRMPTATGVGHAGEDLFVYCLASARPGRPCENPRQRSAYRYSRKYGPLPPCFSRAMRVDLRDPPTSLLVGGTASVRGEDSVHAGDVPQQLEETFLNLERLVADSVGAGADDVRRCILEVRAYHVRERDAAPIRTAILSRFPYVRRLETMQADICRDDLLVEIEALAVGA